MLDVHGSEQERRQHLPQIVKDVEKKDDDLRDRVEIGLDGAQSLQY
ncbi:MAG TPA: hypothetical protein VIA06_20095 [Candidatus Dormibacteraeota bacterium]|nr:hypothetical protein [Candidatus Dormibacteraeota bacterium]